jgi:putative phage-type endonuclease
MYSFIELDQDSAEWLRWRRDGIGGSDAAAVLGLSRFKRPAWLLRLKCGLLEEDPPGPAALEGKRLEPEARWLYIEKTGIVVRPVCLQSTRFPWLRASLDGLSVDRQRAVEIKCGQRNYEEVSAFGSPPSHYYAQVQHVLAVTGLPRCDYWSYRPYEDPVLLEIPRNEAYIARLIEVEARFWSDVERMKGGPVVSQVGASLVP